jgi:hypothetical protein
VKKLTKPVAMSTAISMLHVWVGSIKAAADVGTAVRGAWPAQPESAQRRLGHLFIE